MRRLIRLAALLAAAAMLPGLGCAPKAAPAYTGPVARVEGKDFCILNQNGVYEPVFLNGVNLGAAKAGYFPGEFGVTREDYLRWFQYISRMNVQVVRVYVNQMPAFYDALYEFNRKAKTPLYLMHGVYMNEDLIDQYLDAYGGDGAILDSFLTDIRNAVDMIHGSAQVEKRPGNAGGEYTSDVSPWVIGWILGIEWSADFVLGTNRANPAAGDFTGTFIKTRNASPFEAFLARAAEEAVSYETVKYAQQRPLALSNWCTTDPLSHPNEPNAEMEDAASVDVEHILATEAFMPGLFASYHAYPYYPDFFSYDVKYLQGDDPDPYQAYLTELNAYHTMPVIISEYGIPASRGVAHVNAVTGMAQGFASERTQGEWLIRLNQSIRSSGCAGGFIFSWQDEWFKRTWNSMDYEAPDRRPYWLNIQSPEECFGLMAFEPGEKAAVTLDGHGREWSRSDLLIQNDGVSVYARCDAKYLYLMLSAPGLDLASDTLYLPIDVLAGQGNTHYQAMTFDQGAEYLIRIHGQTGSAVLVDAYYDVFQYDYSQRLSYFDPLPGQNQKDSGCFNPIYLAMNRPQHLPQTGVDNPFERHDTGVLVYGCGDPESAEYHSLADYCAQGDTVELRLPWMLLGFMDPSSKQVVGDFHTLDAIAPVETEGVQVGVSLSGEGHTPMALYTWENWDIPLTRERLKQSYYLLQAYFAQNG